MKKHPNKDVRAAINLALALGWHRIETGKSSHAFCRLQCKIGHSEHQISIWSTPRDPVSHARQILRKARQCKP